MTNTPPDQSTGQPQTWLKRFVSSALDVRVWLVGAVYFCLGLFATVTLSRNGAFSLGLLRELSAYAWPTVVAVSVLHFRDEIVALLHRLEALDRARFRPPEQRSAVPVATPVFEPITEVRSTTITPDSLALTASAGTPEASTAPSPAGAKEASFFDASYPYVPADFVGLEIQKLKLLGAFNSERSRAESELSLVDTLVRSLLNGEHITTSYEIYGSQARLLRQLQQSGKHSANDVQVAWLTLRSASKLPNENVDMWLRFLLNRALVLRNEDGSVDLTDRGRNFLEWATRAAVSIESKLG